MTFNFWLLFAARAVSYFGTYLAPIAVAFAVLDLTGSATDTGIAFACWTVAQVSALLVAGVVADRIPRRLVMVSSDLANVGVRTAMGVLLVSGHAGSGTCSFCRRSAAPRRRSTHPPRAASSRSWSRPRDCSRRTP
jgi:MFS family permease